MNNDNIDIGHEAKIGRISDEAIFYLMSRGIWRRAKAMIVEVCGTNNQGITLRIPVELII